MKRETTITHAGVEYQAEVGRIKRTHLGFEDHGIFSWNLDFEFDGSGQGTGHRFAYIEDDPEVAHGAMRKIKMIVEMLGPWEELPGTSVYVLRGEYAGPILGLVPIIGDKILFLNEPAPLT